MIKLIRSINKQNKIDILHLRNTNFHVFSLYGKITGKKVIAQFFGDPHFNVLKHSGLIVSERTGTTIVYSLNVSAFEDMLGAVLEMFDVGEQPKNEKTDAKQSKKKQAKGT